MNNKRHALVIGYLSTAGDLIAKDLLCAWLCEANFTFDVAPIAQAYIETMAHGVDFRAVDSKNYSHVIFVCGPMVPRATLGDFFDRFSHCRMLGLNLSMVEPLQEYNPFHLLIERDSERNTRPDITFLKGTPTLPVLGVCLVPPQAEYGDRQRHARANALIEAFIARNQAATVIIDTRLPLFRNDGGLSSADQIEAVLSRVDVVVTTRLHGMVLALKGGVPVVAIDAIAGGAKVRAQAARIKWPFAFDVETVSPEELDAALRICLSAEGRAMAVACTDGARAALSDVKPALLAELG